ncbi:RNA-directed DNA polymerase, eukaryota [Tanacetum coccineum]
MIRMNMMSVKAKPFIPSTGPKTATRVFLRKWKNQKCFIIPWQTVEMLRKEGGSILRLALEEILVRRFLCGLGSEYLSQHHHIIPIIACFVGTWIPKKIQVLIISVYAPQSFSSKCILWNFISSLISRWNGESIVMGDFNEVRCKEERWGSSVHFSQFCRQLSCKHLSDHRPILLRKILVDFGAIPFRMYHSWFSLSGFDQMITSSWNSFNLDDNNSGVTNDMLLSRLDLSKQLQDLSSLDHSDFIQKAKVRWAVEGDENSKFFHGIINRKRTNLSVKDLKELVLSLGKLNFFFPNRLCREQADDLELMVSNDEIRKAVWGCGENKSPGPDGYTFEFFRKFWTTIGPDFCSAVQWFFEHGAFAAGCNSSFVTLIPKILNPKLVSDFRPISLIGSIYKVITKILASRLSNVISDLISNVQTAFLPNRQILDGPFIVNEIISRCKIKNKKAMIFKVDFAKAYDSIRWDYLDDVLIAFGFGRKWCSWIQASLRSGKASILVNGSPSSEFHLHRGLKQGDPLAPFLFILIMESFHLSFSRAVEAGIFNGFRIDNSLMISHLFYADDAIFIGEWSNGNLKGILNILSCFSMLSGMSINLKKSQILGMGISEPVVAMAAKDLGCSVMKIPFLYLGVMVGGNMSLAKAWDSTIEKLSMRLSKWKLKTLSIGGRLTLLKSVLGSSPIYNMSLFKVPKSVLNKMENLRRNFFNGAQEGDRKIAWVKWHTVLAAKQFGGSPPLAAAYPSNWSTIIKEFNSLKEQGVDIFSHCKIRMAWSRVPVFEGKKKDGWIDDHGLLGRSSACFLLLLVSERFNEAHMSLVEFGRASLLVDFLSINDVFGNVSNTSSTSMGSQTDANLLKHDLCMEKFNFRTLEVPTCDGAEIAIHMSSDLEVNDRFENMMYGYFLGKGLRIRW